MADMAGAQSNQTRESPGRFATNGPSGVDLPALATLDRASLRRLWRECYDSPIPRQASRGLLAYCLAYRLQENAYGALSADIRTRLRNIAQQLASAGSRPTPARLAPGTRLIRQWRAQRHEVTVLEHGYAYRGKRYASLSAIANIITGSHCSGPRFFGLKPGSTARASSDNGP